MSQDRSKSDQPQELPNQPNNQADYAADRSRDPNRVNDNSLAHPSTGSRVLLWIFAIVIPIITILVEAETHMLASFSFDPMPSWLHFFMLLGVPAAFILGDQFICRLSQHPNQRWAKLALFANAYAIVVSAVYLVMYLSIIPIALIGILALGIGLLALTPVWCTIAGLLQLTRLYAWTNFHRISVRKAVLYSCFGALFATVLLGGLEGKALLVNKGAHLALSQNKSDQQTGLWILRTFGAEQTILRRCYGFQRNSESIDPEDRKDYQVLFYRLTGQPFNSVPRPQRRTASFGRSSRMWDSDWEDFWIVDSEIGGTAVASRVKGLSLYSSTMDINLESDSDETAGPALAYIEWVINFKNDSSTSREARAQISLPVGAVASRLTLWIDGEEREAAFGKRSQVRQAYQAVAVRQRRDPALLTTVTPDKLLLQCFPVPPKSTMKVKIGITVPLTIRDQKAYLRLPYFSERNFTIPPEFQHSIWAECEVPFEAGSKNLLSENPKQGSFAIRGKISEKQLQSPRQGLLYLPAPAAQVQYYRGSLGKQRAWMLLSKPNQSSQDPRALCLVLDGSVSTAKIIKSIDWDSFAELFESGTQVNVIFAGSEIAQWKSDWASKQELSESLSAWILELTFLGGCDQVLALEQAWDLCATEPNSVILWIHGSLPVELSSAEALQQRFHRRPAKPGSGNPQLLSLQVSPGPHQLEDVLSKVQGFKRIPLITSLEESLWHAASVILQTDLQRLYSLGDTKPPNLTSNQTVASASNHLVRLAVYNHSLSAWKSHKSAELKKATKLAVRTRLVTPLSGAVVLESKQQYDRHQLDPGDGEEVPSIPEPTSLGILLIASLLLLKRRRKLKGN